ncbi:hypothetical protein NE237_019728 [Protea cynaroides]|uniref:Ribosomal protein L34e superfamily protein n=1 Tax=Protea cynaroides TaxID=273540 RepID=A0A9Q0H5A4_9MAGN|nr:hypothetical protein NE237_019728 [Protea cynaroides]
MFFWRPPQDGFLEINTDASLPANSVHGGATQKRLGSSKSDSFFQSSGRPANMATTPFTFPDPSISNPRQNHQLQRNRKQPNSLNPLKVPPCDQSRAAAVDVVIFIAVIGASGFLVFPYVKLLCYGVAGLFEAILSEVKDEVCRAPMVYVSMGLSFFFAILGIWGIAKCTRTGKKCRIPNCRGLRNSVEFDIQIETEENLKNSISSVRKDSNVQGLLELVQEHHKELENELRKMAPANGRAIIVFRARCGCPIGRMEVPGPKKIRKIKK